MNKFCAITPDQTLSAACFSYIWLVDLVLIFDAWLYFLKDQLAPIYSSIEQGIGKAIEQSRITSMGLLQNLFYCSDNSITTNIKR